MVRKHRGMPIFTRIVLGCVDESVRFAQCGHSLRLHTKSMLGRIASGRTTDYDISSRVLIPDRFSALRDGFSRNNCRNKSKS
jgi:hypothetical protein